MTQQEFHRWFAAHRAAFSSVASWLKTFPAASEVPVESDQVTQERIAASWFNTLSDRPLKECLEATKLLARGDEDLPKSWDLHPQFVRKICARLIRRKPGESDKFRFGPKQIRGPDGELSDSFKCQLCRDDGHVLCFHSDSVALVRDGKQYGDPGTRYTMVCCCMCDAGERRQQLKHAPQVFDDRRHCRIESTFAHPRPADIDHLMEFLATERAEKFEHAFEAWT